MSDKRLYIVRSGIDGWFSVVDPMSNFASVARVANEHMALEICAALNLYWKREGEIDAKPT